MLLKQRVALSFKLDEAWLERAIWQQDWENLTLMQRVDRVASALADILSPLPYELALQRLVDWAQGFEPMMQLIFPQAVWFLGRDRPEYLTLSCGVLEKLTCFYTAEFAVRQFLQRYPDAMWSQLTLWTQSKNAHHRRLASESCRPRLPWATQCVLTRESPEKSLEILEPLKRDSSRYVLKSVANHLHDHWHFHKDWFYQVARAWAKEVRNFESQDSLYWVLHHALRSGMKAGELEAYALLRYPSAERWRIDGEVVMGYPDVRVHVECEAPFEVALGKVNIRLVLQRWDGQDWQIQKSWQLKTLQTTTTHLSVTKKITLPALKSGLRYQWALQVNGLMKWHQALVG